MTIQNLDQSLGLLNSLIHILCTYFIHILCIIHGNRQLMSVRFTDIFTAAEDHPASPVEREQGCMEKF